MERKLSIAGGVCIACTVIGGLITYNLADIPFGTAFTLILNISLSFLTISAFIFGFVFFRSRRIWVRLIGIFLSVTGVLILFAGVAIQKDPRIIYYGGFPPSLTPEEWQEDGQFLVKAMVDKHADLYALIDSAQWTSKTDSILNRIPSLEEPAVLMEFMRIAGLPGDGHTFPFIMAPCFDLHSFPIILYGFPEGWHVVRAARGLSELEGCRLLAISGKPVEEIYENCDQLIAWENEQSRKEHFTFMVVMAEWLAYHRLISSTDEAKFTFLTADGDTVHRVLSSVHFYPYFLWSSVIPVENSEPPVLTAQRKDAYTWHTMDDGRVLYIQFNHCVEPPDGPTGVEFAREIEAYLRDHSVRRCIIDLRNNDGGGRMYGELLSVIRDNSSINRHGSLFVLTGRRTFSAAVMCATEFQLQTEALFLGEPTGQGPTFYSRPQIIELPHSKLLFAVSSRRTYSGLPFDHRKKIVPDISVAYGIQDFRLRRDPVLAAALQYYDTGRNNRIRSLSEAQSISGRYHHDFTLVLDIHVSEDSIHAAMTDGLPGSTVRFFSALQMMEDNRYAARLPGVSLQFIKRDSGPASEVIVDWTGTPVTFRRADDKFEIPFERFERGDIEGGCSLFSNDAERYRILYPALEQLLNRLGYNYLRSTRTKDALKIFALNLELFPLSSNVYDSYGEALMVDGQIDSAIVHYRRSLAINPENRNAERVIKKLVEMKQEEE
jgi:hypothetical protein